MFQSWCYDVNTSLRVKTEIDSVISTMKLSVGVQATASLLVNQKSAKLMSGSGAEAGSACVCRQLPVTQSVDYLIWAYLAQFAKIIVVIK